MLLLNNKCPTFACIKLNFYGHKLESIQVFSKCLFRLKNAQALYVCYTILVNHQIREHY
jgi:hypothetical protein